MPYDLIARLGGDEFAVLLAGLSEEGAAALVPRLLESIASQPIEHGGQLTVSIGRATEVLAGAEAPRTGLREGSAEEEMLRRLLSRADKDMYVVKNTQF